MGKYTNLKNIRTIHFLAKLQKKYICSTCIIFSDRMDKLYAACSKKWRAKEFGWLTFHWGFLLFFFYIKKCDPHCSSFHRKPVKHHHHHLGIWNTSGCYLWRNVSFLMVSKQLFYKGITTLYMAKTSEINGVKAAILCTLTVLRRCASCLTQKDLPLSRHAHHRTVNVGLGCGLQSIGCWALFLPPSRHWNKSIDFHKYSKVISRCNPKQVCWEENHIKLNNTYYLISVLGIAFLIFIMLTFVFHYSLRCSRQWRLQQLQIGLRTP